MDGLDIHSIQTNLVCDLDRCKFAPGTLSFATLNCRGAVHIIRSLEAASVAGLHVLALQETHFAANISHPDWWVWESPDRYAGVVIAIHRSLLQRQHHTKAEIHTIAITGRAIAVTIHLQNVGPTTFISVYAPHDKKERQQLFDDVIKQVVEPHPTHHIVLLGDFNDVWCAYDTTTSHSVQRAKFEHDRPRSSLDSLLANFCDTTRLLHPTARLATHFPSDALAEQHNHHPRRLDYCFFRSANGHSLAAGSGLIPVAFRLCPSESDHVWLVTRFNNCTNAVLPHVSKMCKPDGAVHKPIEFLALCRAAMHRLSKCKPWNIQFAWDEWKRDIRSITHQLYQSYLSSGAIHTLSKEATALQNALWGRTKTAPSLARSEFALHSNRLYKFVKLRQPRIITPHVTVGDTHTDSIEAVPDAFAGFYCTLYKSRGASNVSGLLQHIRPSTTPLDKLDQPLSVEECIAYFAKVRPFKAGGPDGIPATVWKIIITDSKLCAWITQCFNAFFSAGVHPHTWREGITVPLYKDRGDRFAVENFRRRPSTHSHTTSSSLSSCASDSRHTSSTPVWVLCTAATRE